MVSPREKSKMYRLFFYFQDHTFMSRDPIASGLRRRCSTAHGQFPCHETPAAIASYTTLWLGIHLGTKCEHQDSITHA